MSTLTADTARDLLVRVLADIAPEIDLHAAGPDEEFQQDLGLDSMDFLNLMIGIHDATGLDIPERDYPELSTVAGAVAYLTHR